MNTVISVRNLSFSYNRKKILDDISFDVTRGSILTVMGLNGCGKTTLMNCILGFLKIDHGHIFLEGLEISELSHPDIARILSYVPQNSKNNCCLQVYDYLSLGRIANKKLHEMLNSYDEQIIDSCIDTMNVRNLLNKSMNEISGGEQQLVMITRALIQDTPVLILDEPTASLDLLHQVEYLKMLINLQTEGKTVIFTTHNPNHAFLLDSEVCLIHDKKIFAFGKAKEQLTEGKLKQIYGSNLRCMEKDNKIYCVFDIK